MTARAAPLDTLAHMAQRAQQEDPLAVARAYWAGLQDPDARLAGAAMEYGTRVTAAQADEWYCCPHAVLIRCPEGRFWLTFSPLARTPLPPAPVIPAAGLRALGLALAQVIGA